MTLEELENDVWPETTEESYLIKTCHTLRKKPIQNFEIEDFRIMIGQNIGLLYLIPIAIDVLNKNILAEGHYYEGDLLSSVLTSDSHFWRQNPELFQRLERIISSNTKQLQDNEPTLLVRFKELKLNVT